MKRFLFLLIIFLSSCEKDPIKYTLSVSPNPPQGGYVNPTTGIYNAGETVSLLASPNQFYAFKNWSGGWNGTSTSVTITMDGDKNITGNFEKVDIDEDGVLNENDLCGGTPIGSIVDGSGCAASQKDTDGDGVTDDLDQCDNTSSSAEIVSSSGCEVDLFYLDENGVTIKAISNAQVGMEDEFNGNIYTVIDRQQLFDMISNQENLSFVVTSKITGSLAMAFHQVKYDIGDISHWDVSNITNMRDMFSNFFDDDGPGQFSEDCNCVLNPFNGDISHWDVSNVTNMERMFFQSVFNQDISNWDVSNVTNMERMFSNADAFNQDISNWDVSNVTNMISMFSSADAFNQDISNWDVSNVTNMSIMFFNADAFNQDISGWDVSNVTDMSYMFSDAVNFNQPIGNWNVSKVTNMSGMFNGSVNFNQSINTWDVSNVTDMSYMFLGSVNFNQPIGNWNVSKVTNMSGMFYKTNSFNQPIGNWDVSNVTNMERMFTGYGSKLVGTYSFNQDISQWDTSSVTNMGWMFLNNESFNQPIGNWDVSNVTNMESMFNNADAFNQDISGWDVSNVTDCGFFDNLTNPNWPESSKPNFTNCSPN